MEDPHTLGIAAQNLVALALFTPAYVIFYEINIFVLQYLQTRRGGKFVGYEP